MRMDRSTSADPPDRSDRMHARAGLAVSLHRVTLTREEDNSRMRPGRSYSVGEGLARVSVMVYTCSYYRMVGR